VKGRAQVLRAASALVPDRVAAHLFRRQMSRDHGVSVTDEDPRTVLRTTFGSHCRIRTPIFLIDSTVGDRSYIEAYCRIGSTRIAKFTAIAPGCHIGLAEHPSSRSASLHPIFYRRDPARAFDFAERSYREEVTTTTLGNDVWVGAGAIIKGGVSIGDGAIIGAGAVVTRDVPPYAVVAGIPARVLRLRFEPDDIAFLQRIRWWDWSEEVLRRHHVAFHDLAALRELVEELGSPPRS
jgi:acetyltransferase-like isoleucine patch superfamily enzyme